MGEPLSVTAGSGSQRANAPAIPARGASEKRPETPGLAGVACGCHSFENKLQDSEEEPRLHARSLVRFRK